ncbi:chitin synthase-domain-containing protein, partial [Blastocladiella britannica]
MSEKTGHGPGIPEKSGEDAPRIGDSRGWRIFSRVVTFWAPSALLSGAMGLRTPDMQQAWREKVALCVIIMMVSGFVGLLTFGFAGLACKPTIPVFRNTVSQDHGSDAFSKNVASFAIVVGCPVQPGNDFCTGLASSTTARCHTSMRSHNALESVYTGSEVSWSWDNITSVVNNKMFVYSHRVYSLSAYLADDNTDQFLSQQPLGITKNMLKELVGTDATLAIQRSAALKAALPCFDYYMRAGRVDGTTTECLTSNIVMVLMSMVLLGLVTVKFISALAFDWIYSRRLGRLAGEHPKSWVICLVTAYSEDKDGLATTLDSLSATHYNTHQKLLFVVADGKVTGAGQSKSTPEI